MSAQLFTVPFQCVVVSGLAVPGATITFYDTGTSTKLPIYTDANLTIQSTNPVVANGAGHIPDTYLSTAETYRVVMKSKAGTVLDDIDPYIPGITTLGITLTSATGQSVNTRGALAALTPVVNNQVAFLTEAGREGMFVFSTANLSAKVSADPSQGIYVAPASASTGASGAWVRRFDGPYNMAWWGTGGGSADDQPEIQAAIDLAAATGGPKAVYFPTPASGGFYKCNSPLDLSLTDGVKLFGDAGRVEPTQDRIGCALVYTGTADAFILAGKSRGLTIDGLAIQVSSALFTGDIITLDHDGAVRVTYSTSIVNCMIGGRTTAARFARSCINAQGGIELFVDLCTFGYSDQHIVARTTTGTLPWSNAVTITRNRFVEYNNHAVNIWGGLQWNIKNNVFEYMYGTGGAAGAGVAAGISDILIGGAGTRGPSSAEISGNGFWDCDTGTWIDIYGFGNSITANWVGLSGVGVTFLHLHGGAGVKLAGNRITGPAGIFIDVSELSITGFCDDGSNLVDGGITYNANPTVCFPPDGAFRGVTVFAASGVGGYVHARKAVGVDAVGGCIIIDRNDSTDWRGAALFSWYDSTLSKDCIAFGLTSDTTAPNTAGKIVALLTEDGDLKLTGTLKLAGLVNAVDDAAAAAGGVLVSEAYRNGSVMMVRVA